MPAAQPEPLLVVVLGPTASGKTALALAIAEHCPGEIVNCDSVAMYREFQIGTAKPNAADQNQRENRSPNRHSSQPNPNKKTSSANSRNKYGDDSVMGLPLGCRNVLDNS